MAEGNPQTVRRMSETAKAKKRKAVRRTIEMTVPLKADDLLCPRTKAQYGNPFLHEAYPTRLRKRRRPRIWNRNRRAERFRFRAVPSFPFPRPDPSSRPPPRLWIRHELPPELPRRHETRFRPHLPIRGLRRSRLRSLTTMPTEHSITLKSGIRKTSPESPTRRITFSTRLPAACTSKKSRRRRDISIGRNTPDRSSASRSRAKRSKRRP